MGLYSRTGLGTEYDDDENWFGRYNSMYAGIKQISLTPNLAIKLTDSLSMGVGLEVAYIEVNLQGMVDAGNPTDPGTGTSGQYDVKQKLTGGDPGYGFNLALHYKPVDWLSFGASYRSKIEVTMKGDADFDCIGNNAAATIAGIRASNPLLADTLKDTTFTATEPLPAMLSLGVMVKPMDRLSVSFDLLRTYWSAYNELKIEYDDPVIFGKDEVTKEKNWKDVNRYQVGIEYALYDWMDLRLGYVYDESPVDPDHAEYQIPSNDRQIYSIGSGFHWDAWTIDVAYSYLTVKDRNFKDSNETGVEKASTFEDGQSHIVALNLGYSF
jgi:long-chain fatty acid transport protein